MTRKVTAVMVPWVFLSVFATLYAVFLVPRVREGQLLLVCMGVFAAFVFIVFFAAAITFTRDVLLNRWP